MHIVRQGTPLVSVVRNTEASASRRFLKYYLYGSFNPFLAACPFLGGSVMGGSTVIQVEKGEFIILVRLSLYLLRTTPTNHIYTW